jgi:hypothetical protein
MTRESLPLLDTQVDVQAKLPRPVSLLLGALGSDSLAFLALGFGVFLFAIIFPAPFFRWTVVGSVVLAVRAYWIPEQRKELFSIAVLLPTLVILIQPLNLLIVRFTPHPIDLHSRA